MKRIEAVVADDKLDAVMEALKKVGVGGFTVLVLKAGEDQEVLDTLVRKA